MAQETSQYGVRGALWKPRVSKFELRAFVPEKGLYGLGRTRLRTILGLLAKNGGSRIYFYNKGITPNQIQRKYGFK